MRLADIMRKSLDNFEKTEGLGKGNVRHRLQSRSERVEEVTAFCGTSSILLYLCLSTRGRTLASSGLDTARVC
jgi:hypothetical protein